MTFRKALLATAVAAITATSAYATTGATYFDGERGYETHSTMRSDLTRAQVLAELAAFRANPVLSDGTLVVGGEVGYVRPGANGSTAAHTHAAGTAPHTHASGNSAANFPMTTASPSAAESRAISQQYAF